MVCDDRLIKLHAVLKPSFHLPRLPYDDFFFHDFPCDFFGITRDYGLQCFYLHYVRTSCHNFAQAIVERSYLIRAIVVRKLFINTTC